MSSLRKPPLFPGTSSFLFRRAVLPGIAAAPTALSAATGQAFSSPSVGSNWRRDPRFAEVDRLICEINATCVAQANASELEDKINDDGENIFDIETEKWIGAEDALVEYADEIAENHPIPTIADALVLAKIADFQVVNLAGDIEITDRERNVPKALRAILAAHGLAPTDHTAMTDQKDELEASIASRDPQPPVRREPPGLNAGNWVIRIRHLGLALKTAAACECSLEDGTPEWQKAISEMERLEAELAALRDEFIAAINSYDPKNQDYRYHFNGVEEFTIQYEFITAFRSSFWTNEAHSDVGPILRQMQKAGESWGEHFFEQAQRWNASRGGANV